MIHHIHTSRTAILLLAAVMTTSWSGCSTDITKLLDSDAAEATASSAHLTTALGSIIRQASLNQIDPTHFGALSSPPSVSATGNPSAGTVTIDFGVGTMVNNATVAGTAVGTYSVTGNSVSVTVSFSGLTAQTSAAGSMTVGGSLTVTATLNGSSNITGGLNGSVTTSVAGFDTTVTPNLTYSIDGTPSTGDFDVDGTIGLDSSVYGDWTATLTAINATISQASRDINSGTLEMDRSSFPSVTVTMQFTGTNTGTLDVSPSGFTKSFTL
jgi:hypothetical protein